MDTPARKSLIGQAPGAWGERPAPGRPECEGPGRFEDPVARLAREGFGIPYLMPLQRMAIGNALDALDEESPIRQMVLFPTGFGKSVCFQLPALLAEGITIVIYPLLALIADQERSLAARGIPCAVLKGGLDDAAWERQRVLLDTGKARIVLTNPEALRGGRARGLLAGRDVFHVAVDEAHCVSEWGETFRPSYLELKSHIDGMKPRAVSAFTATASPPIAEAISRHLFGNETYRIVDADIDRPNIRFSVLRTLSPIHSLRRLAMEKPRPMIVFDNSRDGVRRLCGILRIRAGLDARFYHAGLSREEKKETENWFMESADGILCATCAYGMGVDKRNIRTVVHFREPPSVEAYLQEAGRAGRDGGASEAILLRRFEGGDLAEAAGPPRLHVSGSKGIPSEGSLPSPEEMREERRHAFLAYASSPGCRRERLMELMGGELYEPCSGCDVCEGTAGLWPEGLDEIESFFRANRRRFTLEQSLRLLRQPPLAGYGRAEPWRRHEGFSGEPPVCAASGALRDWSEAEAREILRLALRKGILRQASKGLWKGRVDIAK